MSLTKDQQQQQKQQQQQPTTSVAINKSSNNMLSFHALRAKFQHHQENRKINVIAPPEKESNASAAIKNKKKSNNNHTMPRRMTSVARNISDLSEHFPLRRNHHSNEHVHATKVTTHSSLAASSSTAAFPASNYAAATDADDSEEEEEEEEERTNINDPSIGLAVRAVPRTGSFVTELSKRLAQSEKKGEPVSHIIPTSSSLLSLRRLTTPAVISDTNHHGNNATAIPPIMSQPHPQRPIMLARRSVPTSTSSPSLAIPQHAMKRSTTGTSVHSIASSSHSSILSISTATVSTTNTKRSNNGGGNSWHFPHWFSHPPLPNNNSNTSLHHQSSSLSNATTIVVVPHNNSNTDLSSSAGSSIMTATTITTTPSTTTTAVVATAAAAETATITKKSITDNNLRKRSRVIQELLTTEKAYQQDMELIQEIYYNTALEAFTKLEIKQIFINLLDIVAFEMDFVSMLENACQVTDNTADLEMSEGDEDDEKEQEQDRVEITIGVAFSIMMNRMDHVYGDYCKKHEDAVLKIQEVSSRPSVQDYFLKCKNKIQGRTTCWDLPSLLIKPVQRILKYPLLLRELVALTPDSHSDYDQLIFVTHEIQQVADHINEIKRRKDMVEQLIFDKKKSDRNVVQGINKKFTRRVHRKKTTSITNDLHFDDLYKQFEAKQEIARQLERGVQEWLVKIKQNVQALADLVKALEVVYGDSDGIGLRSMRAFKKLVSQLETNSDSVTSTMQASVYNRIDSYLKLFRNPSHIIQKRNRKLVDHDRAQYLITKGEIPDKQLQLSAEGYVSLNAHLLDELPVFLALCSSYFDVVLEEFALIQAEYWKQYRLEWKTLTIEQPFETYSWESIDADYQKSVRRLQSRIGDIHTKPKEEKQDYRNQSNLSDDSGYFLQSTVPSIISSMDYEESISHPLSFSEQVIGPTATAGHNNSCNSSIMTGKSTTMNKQTASVKSSSFVMASNTSIRKNTDGNNNKLTVTTNSSPSVTALQPPSFDLTTPHMNGLFSESQPVFQCIALADYESPERLKVSEGDLIQIWLPSSLDTETTRKDTKTSAVVAPVEWWYGSLANKHDDQDQVYGWIPSNICERI